MKEQAKKHRMKASGDALEYIKNSGVRDPMDRHKLWASAIRGAKINGRKTITLKDAKTAFNGLMACRKGPYGIHEETQGRFRL
jgi:hypothetical protein